ncbi:MAG: PilZ domain-containing protein [Deltaproteobacteria bacterium]|nr:PilZ domain-containing protein [Deltaproteobacteria bacterium]MBW2072283.1 PilZ domain-containing protein [Deltaproteobacteria bacterium]
MTREIASKPPSDRIKFSPYDRRRAFDPDYFARGGKERRSGRWDRRSHRERRRLWKDRRVKQDPAYCGPERRSGKDRRQGSDRRKVIIEHVGQEKRRHPRAQIKLPLIIKGSRGYMSAETKDVSLAGAFICGGESMKLTEELMVTFINVPPLELGLTIKAQVVRANIHCLDDETLTYGAGIRFIEVSEESTETISTLVGRHLQEEAAAAPLVELPSADGKEMEDMETESRIVEIKIKPDKYPSVELYWKQQHDYENDVLVTDVTFPQETWTHLAEVCQKLTDEMHAFSSDKVKAALQFMTKRITAEIEAEQLREKHKDVYEMFADYVAEVNSRTDLDKVRRAQLIHEKACELKLA